MRVGIPSKVKNNEERVAITPAGVHELARRGHDVVVQSGAGLGSRITDDDYTTAGATILATADEVWAQADLLLKVKEPVASEYGRLRRGQVLFTYLHLAPDPTLARGLLESDCIAIAYETVTNDRGMLPLLAPMSEVAGRMSIQVGAHCLETAQGGAGVLLGGVPGVAAARVVVLGGGVSGVNAARMAVGSGAHVTVVDRNLSRLADLDAAFGGRLQTLYATTEAVEHAVLDADLVIGAVLVPGAATPKLVTRAMLGGMRPGSVLVDISIDQGGCFETSRATTHEAPTYVVDGVVHYCVANMPGAVARTSTLALGNATLPFVLALADKGPVVAFSEDAHLRAGLNVHRGRITHAAVAEALGLGFTRADEVGAG